ncbi:MAG: hypothetical protein HS116_21855 [Planctomycetes bacterium]|nr:hypothetical protein [Planctomycetota bacterium]
MNFIRVALMAGVLLCAVGLTAAEPVAALKLAEASLDEAVWEKGAAGEPEAHAVLKAGKAGAIALKAWWGEGLRPAAGSAWRAEVRFKDDATQPVTVQAFTGLPGRYELHRIGGLADGQWKTALVPLPWDQVMKLPGAEQTELVLTSSVALKVASVQVVPGDAAADEARWAAETREWIARVQAEKRNALKPAEAQAAVLPEDWKAKPLVPFVRPYGRLIGLESAPQAGEAEAAVKLSMALNETEPAQFGVYANGKDLTKVTAALVDGGLAGEGGKKLAATAELFAAEYAVTKRGQLFPQRFWPAYAVNVPAGRSHLFWLNVTTTEGAAAGLYRGAVELKADGVEPVRVAVEVEVRPIKLLTMREAGLHMGSCTTGLIPASELAYIGRHNHNSINIWYSGVAPKIVKKSATEFDLDFTVLDDFMKHAKAAGIENVVWFLGGDPYSYPDSLHLERELYRQVHFDGDSMAGRKEFIQKTCAGGGAMEPALRELYKQWTQKVYKHAEEAGWPEVILTPFDEPAKWVQENWAKADVYFAKDKEGPWHTVAKLKAKDKNAWLKEQEAKGRIVEHWGVGGAGPWIKTHFKEACAAIHEGWPKARIYASIHHNRPGGNPPNEGICFLEDVEVFCTNAIHEDPKLGDKVRAGGPTKTFWQYSGCGDDRGPTEARYSFGFFFAAFDSRGSLCWAYNWGNRFDTSSGDNWVYAWTSPNGLIRAPFLDGVREAWDDRRYIETLRARAKEKGEAAAQEAESFLGGLFDSAVKTRSEGGRDTVNDFFARTNDPDALESMRAKIASKIAELSGSK